MGSAGRRVVVEADGGSRGNPGPAGYGAVVRDAVTGEVLAERARSIGRASNNVAEYGGLIAGLEACTELGVAAVEVRMDSKLVVEQMSGRWKVKHPDMQVLARQAAELVRRLGVPVSFTWVPRARNAAADALANAAMDAAAEGREWQPAARTSGEGSATPHRSSDVPEEAGTAPEPAASVVAETRPAEPKAVTRQRIPGWSDAVHAPTTTLLLRHGQTPLSVEKRFSGVGDPRLTEVGEAQARAAAERLLGEGVDAVVCSPLARARRTAALVGAALGLEPVVEDGLRETDFGDWEGSTFAEVRARWPAELDAWLADPAVAPPGGESFADTAVRVAAARDRVLAAYPGQRVVVVSHVSPIKTLLRLALEAPPVALYRLHLDLASVSTVDWYADGPAVVRGLNDTCHLAAVGVVYGQ